MAETVTSHVTFIELGLLSQIANGVSRGSKITWAVDGDPERVLDGVLRRFADRDEASGFNYTGNLFDKYVHISATFEHWISVRELMDLMDRGLAYIKL